MKTEIEKLIELENSDVSETQTEKMIRVSKEMKEMGRDKNQICGYLISQGLEFSKIPTFLKKNGLPFKRESNKWDQFTSFWNQSEIDLESKNLVKYLQDEFDWTEKDSKKYTSSYFNPMNRIFEMGQNS